MFQTIKVGLLVGVLSCASFVVHAQENSDMPQANDSTATEAQTAPPVNGTVVYKSVDKNGKTVFTDAPPTDRPSDAVTVKPSNTIAPPNSAGEGARGTEKAVKNYTSLVVVSPQNDDYFDQEVQAVSLAASLEPGLQDGHVAQLYYDGKPVDGTGLSYTVTDLERGTHTVVAKVLSRGGKVLIESEPIQFHVRRTSLLNQPHKPQPISGSGSGNSPSGGSGTASPPSGGFGGAKGFGGSGGAGGGAAAGGAGGVGGLGGTRGAGGAAPTPGR
jgi:hypothetical protein